MTSTKRKPSRIAGPNRPSITLHRNGPYRSLVAVPAGLRRLARAASADGERPVSDLMSVAPSWLQPRFPLVNALLHELLRLERYGSLSELYRPPRVSRRHRSSIRKAR